MTKKLVELLKALEADETIEPCQHLTDGGRGVNNLIDEIEDEACVQLILSTGQPNFQAHRQLELSGYKVFAEEKDSFGWLTGCIRTAKGIIVYG
jgi:hypothetical protein